MDIAIKDAPICSVIKGTAFDGGIVIAHDKYPLTAKTYTLVGWKGDKIVGFYPDSQVDAIRQLMLSGNFTSGWWIPPTMEFDMDTSMCPRANVQKRSGGMACSGRGCGTFNDYAEANTPEGYLCYSCRQRPRSMR